MTPPSKKPRPSKTSHDDDIQIGQVKTHDELPPRGRPELVDNSKYNELCDKAARLTPGQVLEIEIARGADPVKTRNRISAAIRRYAKPYTPHKLKVRLTDEETIGIYCYEAAPE